MERCFGKCTFSCSPEDHMEWYHSLLPLFLFVFYLLSSSSFLLLLFYFIYIYFILFLETARRALRVSRNQPHGHWRMDDSRNMRVFFDDLATSQGHDPLNPEQWYAVSRKMVQNAKVKRGKEGRERIEEEREDIMRPTCLCRGAQRC